MRGARYAVRRARPTEAGRWVICRNGFPNDVLARGFWTRWGASVRAASWADKEDAAERMYPVK